MARQPRIALGNHVYHVINRANAKLKIFNSDSDYLLFEQTLFEAKIKFGMPILAYEAMPNHIHLSLFPLEDDLLPKFMHWLTMTFTQRYHLRYRTQGTGHLFQSRYKSFLVQNDKYLLQLFLYIERNAAKAGLVNRAEEWRWSSLWIREFGMKDQKKLLFEWPIDMPKNYLRLINGEVEIDRENIGLGKRPAGRPWKMKKL